MVALVAALEFQQTEAFLLLVAAIPLVVAFLVEPRRLRRSEPFFFLWRALMGPRPWLGRMRHWLEFLALLAILLVVIGAVADPGSRQFHTPRPERIVAVVEPDASGSEPAAGARRHEANERARALLDARMPGEVACVVAGRPDGARLTVAPTVDPAPDWVLTGRPGSASSGLADRSALARMVARLARSRPGAHVHWIDARPPDGLPPHWRIHRLAPPAHPPEPVIRVEKMLPGGVEVVAENPGPGAWRGELRLRSHPGSRPVGALDLPPGQARASTVVWPEDVGGVVHLDLVHADTDETVATVGLYRTRPRRPGLAVLAGPSTARIWRKVLEHGFADRIDPNRSGVLDTKRGLDFLSQHGSGPAPFDLVIFESPPEPWPELRIPVLLFGGPGPLGTVQPEAGPGGGFATWERDHPLLRGVDLSPVAAEKVLEVQPAEDVQVLARGPEGPLLLLRPGPPAVAAFSFRFQDSNLFLHPSFIALISNLLRLWGEEVNVCRPLEVGEAFPLSAGSEIVRIVRQDSADPLWVGRAGEGFGFRPRQTGWFTARSSEGRVDTFVNPRMGTVSTAEPPAVLLPEARADSSSAPLPPGSWWASVAWIFAAAALILSLLEWALFHRGVA